MKPKLDKNLSLLHTEWKRVETIKFSCKVKKLRT